MQRSIREAMRTEPQPAPARTDARWLGTGRDDAGDVAAAAERACAGRDAALLIVFAPAAHDLAAAGAALAGDAAVVGCTVGSTLDADGPAGDAIVVAALGGEGLAVSTAAAAEAGGLRDSGAEAAACLGDVADRPHQALLLLVDAAAGDQQEIVRGAYSVAGAGVPLVGGGAPALLHGAAVAPGVVAVALGSDAPLGVGVRHGWTPTGEPMLVTRADGRRILELDGRPALDAYLDRLESPPVGDPVREALLALGRTYPLGLSRRAGEAQVRALIATDPSDRSLTFLGDIPQAGLVWPMDGDAGSALAATDAACAEAIGALRGAAPRGLLVFDAGARRAVLGPDGTREAAQRIAGHAAGAPVAGGGMSGEIARTRGLAGFHNLALAVLAIA